MTSSGSGVGPTLPYRVKAAVTLRPLGGVGGSRGGAAASGRGLRILLYHRVADDDDPLAIPPPALPRADGPSRRGGLSRVDLLAALERLERGASASARSR